MDSSKLAYMANQIGTFFNHEEEKTAIASITHHIRSFWDPRMRASILAFEQTGAEGLQPRVREAVRALRQDK